MLIVRITFFKHFIHLLYTLFVINYLYIVRLKVIFNFIILNVLNLLTCVFMFIKKDFYNKK